MEALLSERTVRLSQLLPATDKEPERFDDALARARTVHGKALALFEERGIQTLFLAWGMATWTSETSSATPAAPVLLRPLVLDFRGAAEADFDMRLDGDWQTNETLLHLLATEYHLPIEADTLLDAFDGPHDGTAPDPTDVFDLLCKEAADVPDLTFVERMVVGTFSYTKLPMVQNLQDHVEELAGTTSSRRSPGTPTLPRRSERCTRGTSTPPSLTAPRRLTSFSSLTRTARRTTGSTP